MSPEGEKSFIFPLLELKKSICLLSQESSKVEIKSQCYGIQSSEGMIPLLSTIFP